MGTHNSFRRGGKVSAAAGGNTRHSTAIAAFRATALPRSAGPEAPGRRVARKVETPGRDRNGQPEKASLQWAPAAPWPHRGTSSDQTNLPRRAPAEFFRLLQAPGGRS